MQDVVCGLPHQQMIVIDAGDIYLDGLPTLYAGLPDGTYGSGSTRIVGDDDRALLRSAAESVQDCLNEVLHVLWPTCRRHGGAALTLSRAAAEWHCHQGGHVIPVGELDRL
jgi:hypothetical protein